MVAACTVRDKNNVLFNECTSLTDWLVRLLTVAAHAAVVLYTQKAYIVVCVLEVFCMLSFIVIDISA